MPSPSLIAKAQSMNVFHDEKQVITSPHVYVFVANDAGTAGSDSAKVAKNHYKRPYSPITGYHENHMGSTYGISLKLANLVTSPPIDVIKHELMVMYYLALEEKGERKYVLPNFARTVDRATSEAIIKTIKELFLNKKEYFIVPKVWLYAINPYFS